MRTLEYASHSKVARKALAGVLVSALVGSACAPIAPSLEKSAFARPGTQIPGGIPLDGGFYQTQIATTEPATPSPNRVALETTTVNQFRATGQVQILLGSLPPGGVRGLFVVSLPSSTVSSLQDFKTEMFESAKGSGVWILRVKAGVHAGISQMVRDHLQKVYLEFGIQDQAPLEADPEETGDSTDTSDTATDADTDDEPGTPDEPGTNADAGADADTGTDTGDSQS